MEKCPYCLNSRWDGHDRTCPQVIGMAGPGAMGPGYSRMVRFRTTDGTVGALGELLRIIDCDYAVVRFGEGSTSRIVKRKDLIDEPPRECPVCGESWGHRWNCTLNQK